MTPRLQTFYFLLIIAVFICSIPLSGDPPKYEQVKLGIPFIHYYSSTDYGQNPQNWDVTQDHLGIMYFANNNGILEFDGISWQNIPIGTNAFTLSVKSDGAGRIYVGSRGDFGFLTYDRTGLPVFQSLMDQLPDKGKQIRDVRQIEITTHGIYFVSFGKLIRYHQEQIEVFPITITGNSVVIADILFACTSANDLLMIKAGRQKSLSVLPPYNLNFNQGPLLANFLQDQIMILLPKQGIFILNWQKALETNQTWEPLKTEFDTYIQKYLPYSFIQIHSQLYAIAFGGGGIILMKPDGNLVQLINRNSGLGNDMVWKIGKDRDGNLWAALDKGIAFIQISSPITLFNEFNGISEHSLFVHPLEDTLLAGTMTGLFYLPSFQFHDQNNNHRFLEVSGIKDAGCWDLLDMGNTIWIGSRSLIILNKNNLTVRNTVPLNYFILCFGRSKRFPNHVFLGLNRGLAAVAIQPPPINADDIIRNQEFNQFNQMIRKITADKNGNLWISTLSGPLLHLVFIDDKINHFKVYSYQNKDGLPDSSILQPYSFENNIYVATSKGIVKAVAPANGNSDQMIFSTDNKFNQPIKDLSLYMLELAMDQHRNLWAISGSTLGCLRRQASGSYNWDNISANKIENTGINRLMVDADNILWASCEQAIYRFDLSIPQNLHSDYHTLIRQVTVNNQKVVFSGNYYSSNLRYKDQYLKSSAVQPTELIIRLPFSDNSITFEFCATWYEHAHKNLFQYMLSGFNTDWSSWQKEGKAQFTNIPEGHYCFMARAKNIFDWPGKTAQFSFSISPPWSRTIWAYLGYMVLFIIVFYGGIRLYSLRLINTKNRLEKIVTKRTQELVVKNTEINKQKEEIEAFANNLYSANHQLNEANLQLKKAKDFLWGEMQLAKKIQTVLLPTQPQIPGYEITGYMKPADDVGGDYYDVIDIAKSHWLVIGDVSGHGVPAGLVMMMVQTSIRSVLEESQAKKSPEKILTTVNKIIHENIKKLGEDKYMTITLMAIQENGKIFFSGLHQDIMIYRANEKRVELIETSGMWIGVVNDIAGMLSVDHFTLQPNDSMILYTDGIVEAADSEDRLFSSEKLAKILQDQGIQSTVEIRDRILESLNGYNCTDDITLLILKRIS
jgi:serine phosphatase RsbU (regulator of sigma subunit)